MATEPKWYAIIDGAQDPRLVDLVQQCSERSCLFKGESARSLAGVAPWLVRIATDEALLATWQEHGRGRNWGVMLLSSLSLAELQRHFRKFLQAKLPDGTIALFRFYDPRVFRAYITAATPAERASLFQGIVQYAVEREDDAGLHQYTLRDEQLLDGSALVA
ncbi:MAG: DUF4123 domain-containing protein [Novosphingobium sp.]|nr:DUF4123 domain-containing protein [Novosphingobium sp.]MCP5380378.1 DUF4123 domain-containing protein [Novosphingobium sp.]MCP5389919.1 DUF4123 domain-containing protein [Novosphingobium sp.]